MTNSNPTPAFTKISPMLSPSTGRAVANQYRIHTEYGMYFQSYDSVIAFRDNQGKITLDETYHNYSRTTMKYRNTFLGMTTAEVGKAIKDGTITLSNLNP